jgi:hypothetical protein
MHYVNWIWEIYGFSIRAGIFRHSIVYALCELDLRIFYRRRAMFIIRRITPSFRPFRPLLTDPLGLLLVVLILTPPRAAYRAADRLPAAPRAWRWIVLAAKFLMVLLIFWLLNWGYLWEKFSARFTIILWRRASVCRLNLSWFRAETDPWIGRPLRILL